MNASPPKYPSSALIGGEWVTSADTFAVLDPATGNEIARVPNLGATETKAQD